MFKGTALKRDNDTLLTASKPINVQYLKTGPKSYKGFVGDTGEVNFYTGEFPYKVTGEGVIWVKYNTTTKIGTVGFNKESTFTMDLDDAKIGMSELVIGKEMLSAYPNPASAPMIPAITITFH